MLHTYWISHRWALCQCHSALIQYVEFSSVRAVSSSPRLLIDCRIVLQQSSARQSTGTTNEAGAHWRHSFPQVMAAVLVVRWPSTAGFGPRRREVPTTPLVASTPASGCQPRPTSVGGNHHECWNCCATAGAHLGFDCCQPAADTPLMREGDGRCALPPSTIDGCVNPFNCHQ
jgi:hypothetical protein